MNATMEQVVKDAMALPAGERAQLAGQLWDSLEGAQPFELSDAWQREIARRRAEIQSGKVQAVPGEAVSRKARELPRL